MLRITTTAGGSALLNLSPSGSTTAKLVQQKNMVMGPAERRIKYDCAGEAQEQFTKIELTFTVLQYTSFLWGFGLQ
jgi:hypothetical protein